MQLLGQHESFSWTRHERVLCYCQKLVELHAGHWEPPIVSNERISNIIRLGQSALPIMAAWPAGVGGKKLAR